MANHAISTTSGRPLFLKFEPKIFSYIKNAAMNGITSIVAAPVVGYIRAMSVHRTTECARIIWNWIYLLSSLLCWWLCNSNIIIISSFIVAIVRRRRHLISFVLFALLLAAHSHHHQLLSARSCSRCCLMHWLCATVRLTEWQVDYHHYYIVDRFFHILELSEPYTAYTHSHLITSLVCGLFFCLCSRRSNVRSHQFSSSLRIRAVGRVA